MKELRISSLSFDNNGWMPDRCSGNGEDQSVDYDKALAKRYAERIVRQIAQ